MVDIARLEAPGKNGQGARREAAGCSQRVEQLHEFNPMLGHRGVRLGITYPEITEMQTRAIIEAACRLHKEGLKVVPEIMIPLVGHREGAARSEGDRRPRRGRDDEGAGRQDQVPGRHDDRGAARRDDRRSDRRRRREFFSFGTNDLTQLTFGFSRDDVGKFLQIYQDKKILEQGSVRVDRRRGRRRAGADRRRAGPQDAARLKLGICGEHGGDPASIHFFDKVGLDYVSASPYRVPVARLAAAQAALAVKVGD